MAHRIVYRKYGEPSVLGLEEFEPKEVGPTDVAIDVAFSGINFGDCIARRGFYSSAPPPPGCVGFEVSGTVQRVGTRVRGLKRGDRVLAVTRFGGYASVLVVDAAYVTKLPRGMSLEHAAALPAVYLTAWHSLYEIARARKGESVLIHAVAGGVGLAALQLAKDLGLVTYGTASSDVKLDLAREHGLDHGINYATRAWKAEVLAETRGRGVDIVLDSLGGEGFKKGYQSLARGGRIITIGAATCKDSSTRAKRLCSEVCINRSHSFRTTAQSRAFKFSTGGTTRLTLPEGWGRSCASTKRESRDPSSTARIRFATQPPRMRSSSRAGRRASSCCTRRRYCVCLNRTLSHTSFAL